MDVKTFSDQLRNRMNEQIEAVRKEEDDELKETAQIIQVIREILLELKQFIHQYEFKDQEEEICFFKEIKPSFTSIYFFHQWVFEVKLDTAFYEHERTVDYYNKRLKHIQAFHARNKEFYRYLKL